MDPDFSKNESVAMNTPPFLRKTEKDKRSGQSINVHLMSGK